MSVEVLIPPQILPEAPFCGSEGDAPCMATGLDLFDPKTPIQFICTRAKGHDPVLHVAHGRLPCGRVVALAQWGAPS